MSLDEATQEHIRSLIDASEILLFMKGNREAPQCGFSATVVQLLDQLVPEYETFDVLADGAVREGIKEFSSWPTIPQLYVRGEFLGGCDIVTELYGTGELAKTLGVEEPGPVSAPAIRVSDQAAEALRNAGADAGPERSLQLAIDARFRSRLLLGPVDADAVVVESNGVTLHLDARSARRASNASIDLVKTASGPAFQVQLPDAPTPGA